MQCPFHVRFKISKLCLEAGRLALASVTGLALWCGYAEAQTFTFRYETGPAYVAQNDNRYGATGTTFTADEVGQQDTLVRIQRASVELGLSRHTLTLTYIPFGAQTRFTPGSDLQFYDTRFAVGQPLALRYLFDGYRLSYLFHLRPHQWDIGFGGSAQVRSAQVALTSLDGTRFEDESDIGLVGALKARVRWTPATGPWVEVDADALSTFGLLGDTTCGIYDVALSLGHPVSDPLDLYVTARLYGGGADIPDPNIDNWANFVSATAGMSVALDRLFSPSCTPAPPRQRQ